MRRNRKRDNRLKKQIRACKKRYQEKEKGGNYNEVFSGDILCPN